MQFHYSTYRIKLHHPFTISRSSHDYYDLVYIYLTEGNFTGIGEAAPSHRYGESFEKILHILNKNSFDDLPASFSLMDVIKYFQSRSGGIRALEAAFDMACYDLWGHIHKSTVYEHFDADPESTPLTSFTIGIDNLDVIQQKVGEAEPYPILKVKLGTKEDKKIIETIRKITDKRIRVDANEGWDLNEALEMCDWLSTKNIEFVEQPLPANRLEETARLKEQAPLKIIADENCGDSRDIPNIAEAFHGINIKLMKCGGLTEAYKMIQIARKEGLEIMLGCMVESSVAVTAAAHLSPLVDYADLDGNLLLSNDPFDGVKVVDGKLVLPSGSGLGVRLLAS